MLVFSTLSAWLRELGIERATIGMLSWVGSSTRSSSSGRRWSTGCGCPCCIGSSVGGAAGCCSAQIGIAIGLLNIAHMTPGRSPRHASRRFALLVAFSSATQDIAIDAWRIEAAPQPMQGVMAAAYQLGYRIAIMVASAGALWIAADHGFSACRISRWRRWWLHRHRDDASHSRARASRADLRNGAGAARRRLAGAQRAPAGVAAGHRRMVHGRRGLPVRRLLHALRHEARGS